jgi:hypothetical protein
MADPALQRVAALHWGVKTSFRGYVAMMGGVTEVGAGAEIAADGGFTFSVAPYSDLALDATGALTGQGQFLGSVRFEAHGGMLKVYLADPALEIGATGAMLTVADSADRTRRVTIALLDLAAMTRGDDGEAVIPTALTMEGCQLLGDHYPPGTVLDPVRVVLAGV